ncbi:hypothetical protein D3C85_1428730 [compost metagenome]
MGTMFDEIGFKINLKFNCVFMGSPGRVDVVTSGTGDRHFFSRLEKMFIDLLFFGTEHGSIP